MAACSFINGVSVIEIGWGKMGGRSSINTTYIDIPLKSFSRKSSFSHTILCPAIYSYWLRRDSAAVSTQTDTRPIIDTGLKNVVGIIFIDDPTSQRSMTSSGADKPQASHSLAPASKQLD